IPAMNALDLTQLFNVKDKVVIVTGGGRGIGKMIADGFVQNGANVYIASRNLDACQVTATELNSKGPGRCIPLQADLSGESACQTFAEEIAKREARVDVLVNNSATGLETHVENTPESAWNDTLSLNVTSPYLLTRFLLPLLDVAATSMDGARVINIGSIAGFMPQKINTIAYDTSKAAVHHMTRTLAAKLARRPNGGHILVNTIAPGLIPSKMTEGIPYVTGKSFEKVKQEVPTERMGEDSDMAGVAIFLASKASGWISGQIITCDGGMVGGAETGVGP
ncbi:Glycoside hydrolase, partial [Phytophthora palmivora]